MEAASTLWCTHEVRQSRQSSYEGLSCRVVHEGQLTEKF